MISFLIYNTETKESIHLENNAASSRGGAGILAAQIIVDNKVEALLTQNRLLWTTYS
ncbi:MAG: hypothetical protein GX129_09680 [Clostridiales bacterium]|nr:hypothetical protein [Clostridiales bacterium]